MFADNAKLYCTITSELDRNILQQDLNNGLGKDVAD